MIRSKTTISYLMLAVYALMLVHALIPHNHGVSLRQSPTAVIYTDGIDSHHRLHHQMPWHTHLQYCEYCIFETDDTNIESWFVLIPHISGKSVEVPDVLIFQTNQAPYHYLSLIHCGFFTSIKLLRAPPAA